MSTMKIKKGDTVKVIAGKDLGTEGKVLSVDVKNHKVLVEGVNKITKHASLLRQTPMAVLLRKKLLLIFQTLCLL